MVNDKLLKVRSIIKKRKPSYKRSQTNQFSKFKGDGWRKPKGMGNKIRRRRAGHIGLPTVGYGSPNAVKGLNKEGFEEVIVKSVKDLESLTKEQVAVLSSTLGAKKRLEVLQAAKKSSAKIANIKDIDAAIKAYTKEKKEKKPKKVVEKPATEEKKEATPAKKEATEKKAEAKPAEKKSAEDKK